MDRLGVEVERAGDHILFAPLRAGKERTHSQPGQTRLQPCDGVQLERGDEQPRAYRFVQVSQRVLDNCRGRQRVLARVRP